VKLSCDATRHLICACHKTVAHYRILWIVDDSIRSYVVVIMPRQVTIASCCACPLHSSDNFTKHSAGSYYHSGLLFVGRTASGLYIVICLIIQNTVSDFFPDRLLVQIAVCNDKFCEPTVTVTVLFWVWQTNRTDKWFWLICCVQSSSAFAIMLKSILSNKRQNVPCFSSLSFSSGHDSFAISSQKYQSWCYSYCTFLMLSIGNKS
jgi:hypothetical protein